MQKVALRSVDAVTATWVGCAAGLVATLPFAPRAAGELADASGGAIAGVVFLGIGPTAIAFTTWAYALARTDAGRMAATTLCVPGSRRAAVVGDARRGADSARAARRGPVPQRCCDQPLEAASSARHNRAGRRRAVPVSDPRQAAAAARLVTGTKARQVPPVVANRHDKCSGVGPARPSARLARRPAG